MKRKKQMAFVVDLRKFRQCPGCRLVIARYKPWDGRRVPKAFMTWGAECHKCNTGYTIYGNMIRYFPIIPTDREDYYRKKSRGREIRLVYA